MLDLSNLTRAPEWRVELHRRRSLNDVQNARQMVAYEIAPSAEEAKQKAMRKNPAFIAMNVRKV